MLAAPPVHDPRGGQVGEALVPQLEHGAGVVRAGLGGGMVLGGGVLSILFWMSSPHHVLHGVLPEEAGVAARPHVGGRLQETGLQRRPLAGLPAKHIQ